MGDGIEVGTRIGRNGLEEVPVERIGHWHMERRLEESRVQAGKAAGRRKVRGGRKRGTGITERYIRDVILGLRLVTTDEKLRYDGDRGGLGSSAHPALD
jgi:hypothetical protein